MKTIEQVLDFCNVFTSYDRYKVERVIELNHVRDRIFKSLSEYDFLHDDMVIRDLVAIDDI